MPRVLCVCVCLTPGPCRPPAPARRRHPAPPPPRPQLEEDIAAKEKLLRASEDERDRVLEELHKAEDSLLAADEAAAKVPRARGAAHEWLTLSLSLSPSLSFPFSLPLSLSFWLCAPISHHCGITLPAAPPPPAPVPHGQLSAGR